MPEILGRAAIGRLLTTAEGHFLWCTNRDISCEVREEQVRGVADQPATACKICNSPVQDSFGCTDERAVNAVSVFWRILDV
jgi:hypothetical protein